MQPNSSAKPLLWSTLAAQFSEQIALAAGPIAVVVMLGGGATDTGFVQMVQTLPFLLLSLPVGVLVDRLSRRRLMIWAEILRGATLGLIMLALATNLLTVPLLAALGFIGTVGTLIFSVAAPALLPKIVRPTELPVVNRWLELARSAAFVAGPPLGGALVGWTGASLAFLVAMSASIGSLLLVSRLPEPIAIARPRRHFLQEVVEGCRFVAGDSLLLPIAATASLFNVGWFILQAVFVVFLINHLGADAAMVGLVFGVYGVGMIAGAFLAKPLAQYLPLGVLIAVGPLGGFIGSLLVLTSVAVPSLPLVGLAFFCFGFGPILWTINTTSLRQVITPQPMLGRVSALLTLATSGARPIGAGIGLLIASLSGPEACLMASAFCFLLQLLIIVVSPAARLRDLPAPV